MDTARAETVTPAGQHHSNLAFGWRWSSWGGSGTQLSYTWAQRLCPPEMGVGWALESHREPRQEAAPAAKRDQ